MSYGESLRKYTGETESDFTTRGDQAHFEEKVAAFTAARGNTPLPGGGSRFVPGRGHAVSPRHI